MSPITSRALKVTLTIPSKSWRRASRLSIARVRREIETHRALVGRKRCHVVDHDVVRTLARRAHRKARIAARMDALVGSHCVYEAPFIRLRHPLGVTEGAGLACIAFRGELGDVAVEARAVQVGLRLE